MHVADLETAKSNVNALIARLLDYLEEYDPLDLIAPVFHYRCMGDPSKFAGAKDILPITDVEHFISLATSRPFPANPRLPDSEVIQAVVDSLDELRAAIAAFYALRDTKGELSIEQAHAGFRARAETLFVRGDEYEIVACEIFIELYERIRSFLLEHIGFDAHDVLEFLHVAEHQVEEAHTQFMGEFRLAARPLSEAWERFRANDPGSIPAPIVLDPLPNPTKQTIEVRPSNAKEHEICEAFSHEFGDNEHFLSALPEWKGWPLNPTILPTKPLIRHQGHFYVPCGPTAFYNMRATMAALIEQRGPTYFAQTFRHERAEYLVEKTAQILTDWFGPNRVFKNVCYRSAGGVKECEADIIVKCGSVLILVECKSGAFTRPARTGSVPRLMRDLGSLITHSQGQALRTLDTILAAEYTQFTDIRGTPLCRIRRDEVYDAFLVSVLFEHLGSFTADLELLRQLRVVESHATPWVVSLADLIVIADILDRPSYFLDFLRRRVRVAEMPHFRSHDELDLLMLYLHQGLWFDAEELEQPLWIHNWTDELDKYYLYKYLRTRPEKPQIAEVPKPQHHLADRLSVVFEALERSRDDDGLACAAAILGLDQSSLHDVVQGIEGIEDRVRNDTKMHSFSLNVRDGDYAVVLAAHVYPISQAEGEYIARNKLKQGFGEVFVVTWAIPLKDAGTTTRALRRRRRRANSAS